MFYVFFFMVLYPNVFLLMGVLLYYTVCYFLCIIASGFHFFPGVLLCSLIKCFIVFFLVYFYVFHTNKFLILYIAFLYSFIHLFIFNLSFIIFLTVMPLFSIICSFLVHFFPCECTFLPILLLLLPAPVHTSLVMR